MPTKIDSFEVARQAGVSRTTVSHVLNNRRDVPIAESTRAHVLAVAAELGYRPNGIARSLMRGRTRTLGVLVPALGLNLVARLVNGIQDACDRHDYRLLVAQGRNDPEVERAQSSLLLEHRVDGLICLPSRHLVEETGAWLSQLAAQGTACVMLDDRTTAPGVDTVLCDDAGGAAATVRHLATLGHRRIAHVSGNLDVRIGRERHAGYQAGLAEMGLEFDPELVVHYSLHQRDVESAFQALRALSQPPTALFATNDYLAAELYWLATRRGLRVPEDLAIVGFGDVGMARNLRLTSVRHPAQAMGEQAVERLLARLTEPDLPPAEILLPTQLIIRETCGAPPAPAGSGLPA